MRRRRAEAVRGGAQPAGIQEAAGGQLEEDDAQGEDLFLL